MDLMNNAFFLLRKNDMNFDKDYEDFIEHMQKLTVSASPVLCRIERVAVKLFVSYLNIRYETYPVFEEIRKKDGE